MNLSNKHKYKHMNMLSLCVYYDLYGWFVQLISRLVFDLPALPRVRPIDKLNVFNGVRIGDDDPHRSASRPFIHLSTLANSAPRLSLTKYYRDRICKFLWQMFEFFASFANFFLQWLHLINLCRESIAQDGMWVSLIFFAMATSK